MFSIKEIVKFTQGIVVSGSTRGKISGVSTDSRTIAPGELFIAIRGKKFDGHDCIAQALSRKAKAVIVSRDWFEAHSRKITVMRKPVIAVDDTVSALGMLGRANRERFSIPVIAVTGSNGKTTTKEMIAAILGSRLNVLKSQGSFNNHIGVPLSLLKLKLSHQAAVFELGMNHKGEIRSLASLVRPNIVVITNAAQAHLEFFNSVSDIIEAKCELLENLKAKDVAIINADCKGLYEHAKLYSENILSFGINKKCVYRASNILSHKDSVVFTLNEKDTFTLPLLGEHNVYNALAAIAVADYLKIKKIDMRRRLKKFQPAALRMQSFKRHGAEIIADCYNANPDSMKASINTLSAMRHKKRRIMVMGDMFELGPSSRYYHSELGVLIAHNPIDKLITVGDNARHTAESALNCGMKKEDVFICETREAVIDTLKKIVLPEDVVLLKGSRAMALEKIIEEFLGKKTLKTH